MCIMVRLCSLRMLPHQRQQTPVYLTYAESKAFYSTTGSAAARPQKAGMAWQTITASLSLVSTFSSVITATQTRPSQDAKGHTPLSSFYTHTSSSHTLPSPPLSGERERKRHGVISLPVIRRRAHHRSPWAPPPLPPVLLLLLRLLRRRRLRVHATPTQAAAPSQRAHGASKNRRPGCGHDSGPAAASPAARAPRSAKRRGRDAGGATNTKEAAGEVARHGVRVRARAGGHGHGRDQEAPEGAAAGSGQWPRRERAAAILRRGVGAVEAHTVAQLQRPRARGGCRGAGEAGVGTYSQYGLAV